MKNKLIIEALEKIDPEADIIHIGTFKATTAIKYLEKGQVKIMYVVGNDNRDCFLYPCNHLAICRCSKYIPIDVYNQEEKV